MATPEYNCRWSLDATVDCFYFVNSRSFLNALVDGRSLLNESVDGRLLLNALVGDSLRIGRSIPRPVGVC